MDDPAAYGDCCAEFYDDIYPAPPSAALRCLMHLAGDGAVLDAGCGTGRYLLALAARGIRVHGIEASAAMIAQLRAKPGGGAVGVTHGDFSRVDAPGEYQLLVCLTNTLALLPDRDAQARAVQRLARRLAEGGTLLFETSRPDHGETGADIVLQTRHGPRRYAVALCPVALVDLDLWTAQAGLAVAARWSDWHGNTWSDDAGLAVSCYRRRA